jgi:hypothetical protein
MKYITLAVMLLGLLGGIRLNTWYAEASKPIIVEQEPEEPSVVQIEIRIDWTEERIKEEIRKMFPEAPETFVRIAKCESGFRPHAHNEKTNDGGLFQLNEKYHGQRLRELGLDPFDVQDNLKYARILYEQNGTQDWSASKHCWNS